MDTLTHIVLGACIGEAIAGKKLGRKALLLGAVAQSIPDIDFVASFWMPVSTELLAHRGITHSFTFIIVVTPLLAWLSMKILKNSAMSGWHWTLFWGLQIFIHDLLDAFNAYGTGWFEPFDHTRISLNTMFVADPLFTIWPIMAFIALLVLKPGSGKRKMWTHIGLWGCGLYLLLGIVFKGMVEDVVANETQRQHIVHKRHFTTPTPLNNLLWYIVTETDSGYFTGYRSIFDKSTAIDFRFIPRNDSLLKLAVSKEDVNTLLVFSNGYYVARMRNDTVMFSDLRFGEMLGWATAKPEFVFYYYLQYTDNNAIIVQRGRFAGWNKETFIAFLRRIKGV